jgi:hypothetical protein
MGCSQSHVADDGARERSLAIDAELKQYTRERRPLRALVLAPGGGSGWDRLAVRMARA